MKKLTTITLSVIAGSVLAYNAYSLTCAQQPTCESLGYTLTSTSDCIGTVLKCPFNTARYYCTTKAEAINKLTQDIVTAAMPDYSKMESRALNVQYTATTNGFIIGHDTHQYDAGGCANCNTHDMNITINGQNVRITTVQTNWGQNTWSYPIKKGATYRASHSSAKGEIRYYFIPTI